MSEIAELVVIGRRMKIVDVLKHTCGYFGVSEAVMLSENKVWAVARPRMIGMSLARELTRRSLPAIGRIFNRDHTSVLAAIRRVKKLQVQEPEIAVHISNLRFILLNLSFPPANDTGQVNPVDVEDSRFHISGDDQDASNPKARSNDHRGRWYSELHSLGGSHWSPETGTVCVAQGASGILFDHGRRDGDSPLGDSPGPIPQAKQV